MAYSPVYDYRNGPQVPGRDVINGSAVPAKATQLTTAAENAPLRPLYGQVRIGPQIVCAIPYQNYMTVLMVWGHGEINSFVSFALDDTALSASFVGTLASEGVRSDYAGLDGQYSIQGVHYRGTLTQTRDDWLYNAFSYQTPTVAFTDAMAGIAYSVFRFLPGSSSGFPRINAIIQGRKLYDSRYDSTNGGSGTHRLATPTTWGYNDNPAICLADFLSNTTFGASKTVDWASVASVAGDCDTAAGTDTHKRSLNLALETVQPVTSWMDTLRVYAGCWLVPSGADIKFVSDKAPASVTTLTHAAGQIQKISALKKRGVKDTPTVMTISYTDQSVLPWRDATATAYAGGGSSLPAGTPRRESRVSLPGLNRYSQAMREAIERLNKLSLNDLSFSLSVFDEQLALTVGDVVEVTHPIMGAIAKQMRVTQCTGEYGRYDLALTEYDPAVYNASVATAPTWADTGMPDPMGAVAAPTALTQSQVLAVNKDSTILTIITLGWTAPADFYPLVYAVTIRDHADPTHQLASFETVLTTCTYSPLPDNIYIDIYVAARRASTSARSADLSLLNQYVAGKTTPPADVAGYTATHTAAGTVLSWTPNTEVDLLGYVFIDNYPSWSPSHGVLTKATSVNIGYLVTGMGATPKTWVKAKDTSGNLSTNAVTLTPAVTAPSMAAILLMEADYAQTRTLRWSEPTSSYPIKKYTISKGTTFAASVFVIDAYTTTVTIPTNSAAGDYWITATDIAGNVGANGPSAWGIDTPLAFTSTVSTPIVGYASAAGTVSAADSIVAAIGKLAGNIAATATNIDGGAPDSTYGGTAPIDGGTP